MPTIFTHAITSAAFGQLVPARDRTERFWFWSIFCSMLPDADVMGFGFGIRYGDFLGHRGFTHSLLFAALVGILVARFGGSASANPSGGSASQCIPARRNPPYVLPMYFALVTASHGLLDAMTDGGLGIAFFSPFDTTRYFLPWRPIHVSPIGPRFFSDRGLNVLLSEAQWIWLPSAVLAAAAWISRRRAKSARAPMSA